MNTTQNETVKEAARQIARVVREALEARGVKFAKEVR